MIDSLNRAVFWLLGALLVAGGLTGLAASGRTGLDIDPGLDEPRRVYARATRTVADEPGLWLGLAIAVSVVVIVVCLVWLRRQFRRQGGSGISTQQLERSKIGRTEIDPAPVARTVAADLKLLDGIHASSVRLTEVAPVTEVIARVDLVRGTDVADTRRQIDVVLERLRSSLGSERIDADIRIHLASADSPRVV